MPRSNKTDLDILTEMRNNIRAFAPMQKGNIGPGTSYPHWTDRHVEDVRLFFNAWVAGPLAELIDREGDRRTKRRAAAVRQRARKKGVR